jgi:hypothetical protein
MYFSNLVCDVGYSDHFFVWTPQLLKTKELHSFETLGNSDPMMKCYILEDLNPPPFSLLLFCHFTLHGPSSCLWQNAPGQDRCEHIDRTEMTQDAVSEHCILTANDFIAANTTTHPGGSACGEDAVCALLPPTL